MRKLNLLRFFLPLLIACSVLAQVDNVIVNGEARFPQDRRPFGKYLVEICTLSGEDRTLTCLRTPLPLVPPWQDFRNPRPLPAQRLALDQTITLKLACDIEQKLPCNVPLIAGKEFFIIGKSSSGEVVQQKIVSGNVTPLGGNGTVRYRANAPTLVVVRATAGATSAFSAAAPVDILLPVIAPPAPAAASCPVLPPAPPAQTTPLDAASIVTLLGNPTPFVLTAQGPNTIAVYATRQPLRYDEQRILESFQEEIAGVAGRSAASLGLPSPNAKPFTVELKIPHAAAFGDVAARINTLNYSQFTVQNAGINQIRVTSATSPDCDTWKGFLSDIRRLEWQLVSEPMNAKLFYLSSTDVATAFTGLASPASTTTAASSAAAAATTATVPAASGTNASITITQPPGSNVRVNSDTTPCVVAGLASGNPTACGASSTPAAASATATTASAPAIAKPALAMASVSVASGIGEQNPPDLLVYSDTNPGDDAQIQERNRVLALLDLPRPEMIINAWVMQNSSTNPKAMGAFSSMVKDLVADYDQEFERVVLKGWESVKELSTQDDNYFNQPFRSYISNRFVADTFQDNKPDATVQDMSQAFLDRSQAKLAGLAHAADLGLCGSGQYCLGYTDLFDPVKPALTDLLLTIIAAQDPIATVHTAVAYVEGRPRLPNAPLLASEAGCDGSFSSSVFKPNPKLSERCHKIWRNLGIESGLTQNPRPNCTVRDYQGILYSLFSDTPQNAVQNPGFTPLVHLQCFEEQAEELFGLRPHGNGTNLYGVGLLRAAIADFLFNYKLSQQYPHEFGAYDLTQSADALNNALSPLIDAFNRDLRSYQLFVRADLQFRVDQLNAQNEDRCCVKRLFGLDKPSFFDDGLVTVRTISGQATTVNTTSQSFLNASTAPQLTTLLNSLTATNTSATPGEGSLATAVFGANPVKRFSALAGALANYQTTFAQIGRSLNLTATPRSLNTASSAEIDVTLNADESAGGPTYNNGATTDPNINTSRVASHDTTTRIRVDSLKLFEVSSFTAIVERSRSRFPLLPPFVEIPYVGTFAGIPIGSAKEFHSSTAVMSAYVMPTAADIATGLRFVPDLVVDGANPGPCSYYKDAAGPDVKNVCLFRKALSLHDLRGANELPIVNFNKLLSRCFATDTSQAGCQSVTLDRVPRSMN